MCAILNLPKPNTAFRRYTRLVKESVFEVAEMSMNKYIEEAIEQNNCGSKDLTVVYDGTWQKKGYKSKNGVCTLTSLDTGKELDMEVFTKFCSGCIKFKADTVKQDLHRSKCIKNCEGASGGVETQWSHRE